MKTEEILQVAKDTKSFLATLTTEKKREALNAMAEALLIGENEILAANAKDLDNAKGKISDVMLDRLLLNHTRIEGMAKGITDVGKLQDPVGVTLSTVNRPNGLTIKKVTVPIGVCAIIYESRPNVTSDAAALCLMSGNVCVLRSGKEAHATSTAIVAAMKKGLAKAGLPETLINILEDTSRESATALMKARGYIDLLIPRGGAGLIRSCVENATVPCIETGTGICHIYVDKSADIDMALSIVENAKTSRPSVCNAAEVCLVHKDIAEKFLPKLQQRLVQDRIKAGKIPVEFRSDWDAVRYLSGIPASDSDFDTEFLDYILAVRLVDNVNAATAHIRKHSTGHSEACVAEDEAVQNAFLNGVDSAAVYINASTRFTDGGEFGLGCEMGISTQKLHARGPMGLEALTSYQYRIFGNGQIR